MPRASGATRRRYEILCFGVAPYEALEREWKWAEELGFHAIWIPDTWSISGLTGFETWTLLAALARATSRVRLGSLVTTIMARLPTVLAAQAMTLDHLSRGRVELGMGLGDTPTDCDVVGVPQWSAGERVARLEEQLTVIDRLLRGETVTHAGTYYSTKGAQLGQPVQRPRPPLILSAEGHRMLRLAARYADAWSTLGGQQPRPWGGGSGQAVSEADALSATEQRIGELADRCAELGRDSASLRKIVLAYRRPVDPLSSLDAFDQFVGAYADLGFEEFVFYWPPTQALRERRAISSSERSAVERIAAARFS